MFKECHVKIVKLIVWCTVKILTYSDVARCRCSSLLIEPLCSFFRLIYVLGLIIVPAPTASEYLGFQELATPSACLVRVKVLFAFVAAEDWIYCPTNTERTHLPHDHCITKESLIFRGVQFSWILWVSLTHS